MAKAKHSGADEIDAAGSLQHDLIPRTRFADIRLNIRARGESGLFSVQLVTARLPAPFRPIRLNQSQSPRWLYQTTSRRAVGRQQSVIMRMQAGCSVKPIIGAAVVGNLQRGLRAARAGRSRSDLQKIEVGAPSAVIGKVSGFQLFMRRSTLVAVGLDDDADDFVGHGRASKIKLSGLVELLDRLLAGGHGEVAHEVIHIVLISPANRIAHVQP